MTPTARLKAVVFLTGFGVVSRNHEYISRTVHRGLVPLLITPEGFRTEVEEAQQHPNHVVHQIREISFAQGALSSPWSFTPDVVTTLKKWETTYDFVGVCAVGEALVEQAGLVADRYHLKNPGLRASQVCRSKYLQRWYLPQFAPRYLILPPAARAQAALETLDHPVIVKPVSRHSSSGVAELADAQAGRIHLSTYPPNETLLVEERIVGPEFSVEALVQGGSVRFAGVTSKRTTEDTSGGFTEVGHSLPYRGDHEESLLAATREVLAELDFQDGIAHAEWRVAKSDGRPVLMEVAARTPGDAILDLYRLATGASMEEAVLQICLGEIADYPPPRRSARQGYVEHPVGARLIDVQYDGTQQPSWVAESGGQWPVMKISDADDPDAHLKAILVLAPRGVPLPAIDNSDSRAVTFILDGPDEHAVDALEAKVVRELHLVCTELSPQPAKPL